MSVLIPHCINSLSLSLSLSLSFSLSPPSLFAVKCHKGNLIFVFDHISGHGLVCMQGHFHYYEGHPPWKVSTIAHSFTMLPPPSNYITQILIWKNPLFYSVLWLTAFPILNSSPDVFPLAPAQAFQLNFSFWTSYHYHFLANL